MILVFYIPDKKQVEFGADGIYVSISTSGDLICSSQESAGSILFLCSRGNELCAAPCQGCETLVNGSAIDATTALKDGDSVECGALSMMMYMDSGCYYAYGNIDLEKTRSSGGEEAERSARRINELLEEANRKIVALLKVQAQFWGDDEEKGIGSLLDNARGMASDIHSRELPLKEGLLDELEGRIAKLTEVKEALFSVYHTWIEAREIYEEAIDDSDLDVVAKALEQLDAIMAKVQRDVDIIDVYDEIASILAIKNKISDYQRLLKEHLSAAVLSRDMASAKEASDSVDKAVALALSKANAMFEESSLRKVEDYFQDAKKSLASASSTVASFKYEHVLQFRNFKEGANGRVARTNEIIYAAHALVLDWDSVKNVRDETMELLERSDDDMSRRRTIDSAIEEVKAIAANVPWYIEKLKKDIDRSRYEPLCKEITEALDKLKERGESLFGDVKTPSGGVVITPGGSVFIKQSGDVNTPPVKIEVIAEGEKSDDSSDVARTVVSSNVDENDAPPVGDGATAPDKEAGVASADSEHVQAAADGQEATMISAVQSTVVTAGTLDGGLTMATMEGNGNGATIAGTRPTMEPIPVPPKTATKPSQEKSSSSKSDIFKKDDIISDAYIVIERIGKGGMGEVYLVKDLELGTNFAIKVVTGKFSNENEHALDMLRNEAKKTARMHTKNIVFVNGLKHDDRTDSWYIVMEYVDGGNMRKVLKARKKISEVQGIVVAQDVAKALCAAEELKIVHRDIKPDNIMFTKGGDVKLSDLGIAKHYDGGTDGKGWTMATGGVIGTPAYLSPEQINDPAKVNTRSDIYSLGATLFEMLTGRTPFIGEDHALYGQILYSEVPNPKQFNPELSDWCAKLILKMMDKKQEKRFQSPQELVDYIENGPYEFTATQREELVKDFSGGGKIPLDSAFYRRARKAVNIKTVFGIVGGVALLFLALLALALFFLYRDMRNESIMAVEEFAKSANELVESYQALKKDYGEESIAVIPMQERHEKFGKMLKEARKKVDEIETGKQTLGINHEILKTKLEKNGKFSSYKRLLAQCDGEYDRVNEQLDVKGVYDRLPLFVECGKMIDSRLAEGEKAGGEERWDEMLKAADDVLGLDEFNMKALALKKTAEEKIEALRNKAMEIARHLKAAEDACGKEEWDKVLEEAKAVIYLDNDNGKAIRLKADANRAKAIGLHLKAAEEARGKEEWDKVLEEANAVVKLDNGNDKAIRLKTEANRMKAIGRHLTAAEYARDDGDWEMVLEEANAVLALDKGNGTAQYLKKESERRIKIGKHLEAARKAREARKWDDVIAASEAVIDLDAGNKDAERLMAEAAAAKKAEEEAARKAEEERVAAAKKAEEEAARKAEEERVAAAKKAEEAARKAAEEAARKADEAARKAADEAARKAADEAARKAADEAARKAAAEAAKKAEEERVAATKKAEEERVAAAAKKAEEEAAKKEVEEAAKKAEEERVAATKKATDEAARKAADEAAKKASEQVLQNVGEPTGEVVKFPLTEGVLLEMRRIPKGTFMMGKDSKIEFKHVGGVKNTDQNTNETLHEVLITKDFYIGVYELTSAQYGAVMDIGGSQLGADGGNMPANMVSWNDAREFCRRMNAMASERGWPVKGYRFELPTEAQWEYACRAGTNTAFNNGKVITTIKKKCENLEEVAWYGGDSEDRIHEVGGKKPNAWGLYDMHGNVAEWCLDSCGVDQESGRVITDTYGEKNVAPKRNDPLCEKGDSRVNRGGSFRARAERCRSASRAGNGPHIGVRGIGFRVALVKNE